MILGLTGKIGSGKSTAARFFKAKGFKIIDSDKIAHSLYQKDISLIEKLKNAFGNEVINSNNRVNRTNLAQEVLENVQKIHLLNKITHPVIAREIKKQLKSNKNTHFIIEAYTFDSPNFLDICQKIVLIKANKKHLLERLNYKSNATKILAHQKNFTKPDFIISNNHSEKEFHKKLALLWKKIIIFTKER